MYDSILVPTDGSAIAMSALDYAIDVAAVHGATLRLLYVADVERPQTAELTAAGERVVAEAAERAERRAVTARPTVHRGDPASVIVDAAAAVDAIVMATHRRRGVQRALLGGVTEQVLGETPVPVVVVGPDADRVRYPCEGLLVAIDGSDPSNRALTVAIDIAASTGATLHLLHVVETARLGQDVRSAVGTSAFESAGAAVIDEARRRARAAPVDIVTAVTTGYPHREIRRYVTDQRIDLLALGTRGATGFDRYALGGVSSKLIRTAPVPLLATKGSSEHEP